MQAAVRFLFATMRRISAKVGFHHTLIIYFLTEVQNNADWRPSYSDHIAHKT